MLIPVPGTAGAVVVGESVITFISANAVRSTAIKPTMVKVRGSAAAVGLREIARACLSSWLRWRGLPVPDAAISPPV